jgi:hypothetical protein
MLMELNSAASFSGPKMPPGIWWEMFETKCLENFKNLRVKCKKHKFYQYQLYLSQEFLDYAGDGAE